MPLAYHGSAAFVAPKPRKTFEGVNMESTLSSPQPPPLPVPETGVSDTEKNMLAQGVPIDEPGFEDYFGFDEVERWYFPDGKQFIMFKIMNEGARSRYQKATSKDVRLFKTSGDASIKIDPSQERTVLFEESVVGWYLVKKNHATGEWEDQPFDRDGKAKQGGTFDQWRLKADPRIISDLEAAIRKANPWLRNDLTVKDIDEQLEELKKMREEAVAREEGK
jgi:hypothetical protein